MRFRCNRCGAWPRGFEFESDTGACPRCGACGGPGVAVLIDVHLVVLDAKGAIDGSHGRQYVACEPGRAYLALVGGEFYSASGDVRAVTCPRCIGTREWRERAAQHEGLRQAAAQIRRVSVDTGGCCG